MGAIVGIDEVGRGSWAGPVVAGAVILKNPILGLKDSKKLTKLRRKMLAKIIHSEAIAIGLGWVFPLEIDKVGITTAIEIAMKAALVQITHVYDEVVIDGNYNFLSGVHGRPLFKVKTMVGADNLVPAVSAASIMAKVARDDYMAKIAKIYPKYGFEKHVGYGTDLHRDMLKQLGVSYIHRRSYKPVKDFLA